MGFPQQPPNQQNSGGPTMQGTANWMSQMGQQNGVGQAPNGMAHNRAMLALQ